MSDTSSLDREQALFLGHLQADTDFFADIKLLQEEKGVTEADIDLALGTLTATGGKLGACAVVLAPVLTSKNPNAPSPMYDIEFAVQVIEQPLLNRSDSGTGKTCTAMAQRVRQLFHHFYSGAKTIYRFSRMELIPQDPGRTSYGVTFARESGDPHLPRVATPQAAASGTNPITLTLTCATAGAAIYYTLDGSYPSARNAAAILYAAPFEVADPGIVCIGAQAPGYLPSSLNQLTIST